MGKFTATEVDVAVNQLQNGGTILYPSETVWALGCDAENEAAIDKIINLKGFRQPKAMVIMVGSLSMLMHYVPQLPPKAGDLIEFYDKALSIVYENNQHLPDKLKAEDGSIAIRLTKDPFCAALLNTFGRAVVATVATIENAPIPLCYDDISTEIKNGVDYTASHYLNFNGGALSTMLRIDTNNELVFLRKGGLKMETDSF